MPSITQWSALGGLGKAAGQSLQELLANRLAEQKRQDLLAEAELRRQETLAQQEETRRHYRTTEATAERNAASLEGQRTDAAAKYRADAERVAAAEARRVAAQAKLDAMTPDEWESTPQHQRYGLINEAYGGGSPPAGVIETAKEKQEREAADRQKARDDREYLIRLTAGLRPEPQGSAEQRRLPPGLARVLTDIHGKYPDINKGLQNFEWKKRRGELDVFGEEADLLLAKERLERLYRTGQLAGAATQNPLEDYNPFNNPASGPPAPQAPQAPTINVNGLKVRPVP